MTNPNHSERQLAQAYILTARISQILVVIAFFAGLIAWAYFGIVGGIATWALCAWLAQIAKAPMPDHLRKKF